MVSMLTILPALLTMFGRRAFWPFVPRVGSEGTDETHGAWRRIAEWVARAPRRVWVGTTALLVVMVGGLAFLNSDLTTGNMFRDEVDSVQGQELIEAGSQRAPTRRPTWWSPTRGRSARYAPRSPRRPGSPRSRHGWSGVRPAPSSRSRSTRTPTARPHST